MACGVQNDSDSEKGGFLRMAIRAVGVPGRGRIHKQVRRQECLQATGGHVEGHG